MPVCPACQKRCKQLYKPHGHCWHCAHPADVTGRRPTGPKPKVSAGDAIHRLLRCVADNPTDWPFVRRLSAEQQQEAAAILRRLAESIEEAAP